MATTTTNNGWTIPQSTDLVTNGATAIATLGNGIDTSVGTGLKAWTAYTPTLTGWGVGNGTWDSYYVQLGKTVIWRVQFTVGSTTTFGNLSMTPPVAPRSTSTRATRCRQRCISRHWLFHRCNNLCNFGSVGVRLIRFSLGIIQRHSRHMGHR
jgi:hypothetical protein